MKVAVNFKEKDHSIELLKIIAMIMIVTLHLVSQTKMLSIYSNNIFSYSTVWIIHAFNFVAVNCYVLITGYFGVNSKFNFSKILRLWLQIFFYSILIYLILLLTGNVEFKILKLLQAILLISFKNYWFATMYIGLYLLMPFLNIFIAKLSKNQYKNLLIICFILFSVWPTIIPWFDNLNFGGSYSITWFINLYLIGGYLKKYFDFYKIKSKYYLYIYIAFSTLTFLSLAVIEKFSISYFSNDILYSYNSFSVLLASIALFCYFKTLKIKNVKFIKLISFFAPLTFGVYLIHENQNIRKILWSSITVYKNINPLLLIVYIYFCSIFIYVVLSLIDYIRKILFKKIDKKVDESSILKRLSMCYFEGRVKEDD